MDFDNYDTDDELEQDFEVDETEEYISENEGPGVGILAPMEEDDMNYKPGKGKPNWMKNKVITIVLALVILVAGLMVTRILEDKLEESRWEDAESAEVAGGEETEEYEEPQEYSQEYDGWQKVDVDLSSFQVMSRDMVVKVLSVDTYLMPNKNDDEGNILKGVLKIRDAYDNKVYSIEIDGDKIHKMDKGMEFKIVGKFINLGGKDILIGYD